MKRRSGRTVRTLDRQIKQGWHVYWKGESYRVVSTSSITLDLVHVTTGEHNSFDWSEVFAPCESEADAPIFAPNKDGLESLKAQCLPNTRPVNPTNIPQCFLDKAQSILDNVKVVDATVEELKRQAQLTGSKFAYSASLKQACVARKLGVSTYYKYAELVAIGRGDRDLIAAGLRRRTLGQTKMSLVQLHFIDRLILRFFARADRVTTPSGLYEKMEYYYERTGGRWIDPEKCGEHAPEDLVNELLNSKIPMETILGNKEKAALLTKMKKLPSRQWLYGYLEWFKDQPNLDQDTLEQLYGEDSVKHEQRIWDTFVHLAARPLQYVFADHHLLKLFVVDEETRTELDRLWLTVLIDAYSRSILGFALCYEAPCIESLQLALRHAIWPKTSHKELGIEREYVPFGIPGQLSLDNAWAHLSHSLESLASSISQNGRYISIDLDWRPPYRARYGALIERYFRNLGGKIREHIASAMRSSDFRDTRNAAKKASLIYSDVYEFIHQVVVQYQHTGHSELGGMTPHEKWQEAMLAGVPQIPPLDAAMERRFWRMEPRTRQLDQQGVRAFGMHYSSNDLHKAERVGRDGKRVEYTFRYQPYDISRIAVFREGEWVGDAFAKELKLPDGTYRSISLWEREMAQELARKVGRSARDWHEFLEEFSQRQELRVQERKKAHQGQQPAKTTTPAIDADAVEKAMAENEDSESLDYTSSLLGFLGTR